MQIATKIQFQAGNLMIIPKVKYFLCEHLYSKFREKQKHGEKKNIYIAYNYPR